jgi:3-hydroxymyristoyl/3-hydroxydecanoyl-(acyl carrier protein) dehydratase
MIISRAALEFTLQHPALRGHFPGNPVVPAVVLLDEVLHQASTMERSATATSPPRWKVGNAKFHHPLRPGEPLSLELDRQSDGSVRFRLSSAGTLIAQGLLLPASGITVAA